MPRVFRKQYTRPIPPDAERVTRKGKPAVRFMGPDGKATIAVLTKGGDRCRMASPNWYGSVGGKHVALCPNKAAAEMMLAGLLNKAGLASAGYSDPFEEHRQRPLCCPSAGAGARRTRASRATAPGAPTWPTSAATSSPRATLPSTPG